MQKTICAALTFLLASFAHGQEFPRDQSRSALSPPSGTIVRYTSRHNPVFATQGMVVSQNETASKAGVEILKKGGNAVDAAVTVATVLAVTLPRAGNIAGGGFLLVYDAENKRTSAFDFRSTVPGNASIGAFINSADKVDEDLLKNSPKSPTIPGTIAGLDLAHRRYGRLPWADTLQPAIALARNGIPMSRDLRGVLIALKDWISISEESRKIYLVDGEPPAVGEILKRPGLAWTLERLAEHGADDFYNGEIARRIAEAVRQAGGFITLEDLAGYRVNERETLVGDYRGYDVLTVPPPSAGVIVLEMLNMLECKDLSEYQHGSANHIHLLTEIMKRAYRDRLAYIEDPAFVPVPTGGLASQEYADSQCEQISGAKATPVAALGTIDPWQYESRDTTHFSIVDNKGNAVALTYTLGSSFGSGFTVPDTGILLNNQIRIFLKPGTSKETDPRKRFRPMVEGKRMISTIAPIIVLQDGRPIIVTGSPGGDRILTTNLQVFSNLLDFDMNPASAVQAPRVHHNYVIDVLRYEDGVSADSLDILKARGHETRLEASMGSSQTIVIRQGLWGAADQRRPGAKAIGY